MSIEDAMRVEDPILFERPCNPEGLEVILKCVLHEVQRTVPKASILASTLCIEDARSLVPASKAASASKRNFSTIKAEPWLRSHRLVCPNPTPNPLPFGEGEGSFGHLRVLAFNQL